MGENTSVYVNTTPSLMQLSHTLQSALYYALIVARQVRQNVFKF